jgi:ATP-dependent Clp protease ATP-binding subunit ClpX
MENLMLDIMFELPEREAGKTYTITEKVVRGDEPLFKPSAA